MWWETIPTYDFPSRQIINNTVKQEPPEKFAQTGNWKLLTQRF